MATFLQQTQFVHRLARNLLAPKHTYYQEEYIRLKLIENPNYAHHSVFVRNGYGEKLKVSVFINQIKQMEMEREREREREREKDKQRDGEKNKYAGSKNTQVCIIYLHGLGSHRLEGTTLLGVHKDCEIGVCSFDFTGSGKSQGEVCSYGIKEYKDIGYIIDMLRDKFHFKKFVLWGRSMGATASLLYTCSPETDKQSILFQVLDSPFSSFSSIAKHHAKTTYNLPTLFLNFGLSILQQHFKNHQFNPFKIDVLSSIKTCQIPTLFMYSQTDGIIPPQNTIQLIKNFNQKTLYQKLIINQSHNNFRNKETLEKSLQIIKKYTMKNKIKEKIKYKKGVELYSSIDTSKSSTQNIRNSNITSNSNFSNNHEMNPEMNLIKIKKLSRFTEEGRNRNKIKHMQAGSGFSIVNSQKRNEGLFDQLSEYKLFEQVNMKNNHNEILRGSQRKPRQNSYNYKNQITRQRTEKNHRNMVNSMINAKQKQNTIEENSRISYGYCFRSCGKCSKLQY